MRKLNNRVNGKVRKFYDKTYVIVSNQMKLNVFFLFQRSVPLSSGPKASERPVANDEMPDICK